MAKLFLMGNVTDGVGGPGYWQHETGELPGAMWAYINHVAEPQYYPAPTSEQLRLVVAYLDQWVNHGVWAEVDGQLAALRREVHALATVKDVVRFVAACVRLGMDPL